MTSKDECTGCINKECSCRNCKGRWNGAAQYKCPVSQNYPGTGMNNCAFHKTDGLCYWRDGVPDIARGRLVKDFVIHGRGK